MADQQMSWRKATITTYPYEPAKTSTGFTSETSATSVESWRSKGLASKTSEVSPRESQASLSVKADSAQGRMGRIPRAAGLQDAGAGPAAPLNPLHIGHSKPLPHPSTYGGSDNWALTPTGSLPSLPGTPSKAMHSMGWHHIILPHEERQRESSGSKELSAARALLNRRNEEAPARSPGGSALPRQSPKRQARPLQSSSPQLSSATKSTSPMPNFAATAAQVRPISPLDGGSSYSTPSPVNHGSIAVSPALRHRDSTNSVASSSLLSLNAHPLTHSRRASQVFHNSPSSSVVSSGMGPGYLVYRPPHLRRKDSIHALKPKVAHYDRVRTPSLRGHSRSPDPTGLIHRSAQVESTTPSESSLTSRPVGKRRLSSLGSFNSSIYDDSSSAKNGLDSRSLIAKLTASRNHRKFSDASSYRFDEPIQYDEDEEYKSGRDDVDLSADDLMMQSNSLTDEFCLSRTGSINDNRPIVDIFEVGDRLGPGMMHDGLEVSIAETSEGFKEQNADLTGSQLEVVKKLGEGSYAVVYLVKEVAKGAKASVSSSRTDDIVGGMEIPRSDDNTESEDGDQTVLDSEGMYSTTLKASRSGHLASGGTVKGEGVEEEPRLFALKCLCKRDLSDEMLKVQRLEATIQQSIPQHPYIVTLYRTYETAEWLFLILEYCPGQDLFYWLEQASDATNLGAETPLGEVIGGNQSFYDGDMTATFATPPSPSLLASTESRFLLSTRRLKLISRMFQQMCTAISFCHDRNISHRDIKPENFIVEDTRGSASSDSIKVKLTDFGLAVAQEQCIDFDCGSKPYMSYECRNNSTKWYDPKQSDIWSLGIVLLNLIFHRNPFVEPNVNNCPSFASYVEDPVQFLVSAFGGLKWESATFLAENVFCDVSEGMDEEGGPKRKRITAKQFGEWATHLEKHMGPPTPFDSNSTRKEPGADEDITSPLWHSRSPSSSVTNSVGASPAGGNVRANSSILQELASMGIHQEEWEEYGSLFPEESSQGGNLPSPSVKGVESPLAAKSKQSKDAIAPTSPLVPSPRTSIVEQTQENETWKPMQESKNAAEAEAGQEYGEHHTTSINRKKPLEINIVESNATDETDANLPNPPLSAALSTGNPKRRKRGARKGRTMTKQELKRSQSVGNLSSLPIPSSGLESGLVHPRDDMLKELAEASQTLAREMSKAMKRPPIIIGPTMTGDAAKANSGSDESPTSETFSAEAASTLSQASTQYTNFSWQDSVAAAAAATRRPASIASSRCTGEDAVSIHSAAMLHPPPLLSPPSLPMTPTTATPGPAAKWDSAASRRERIADRKSTLEDSGRTGLRPGIGLPAPPVMTNWRDRNSSRDSMSSEVGTIYSTASAPAALAARRQYQSATSTMTTTSTSSSSSASSSNVLGPLKSTNNRGTLAAASNLGTINERTAARPLEKKLDASYLAEIFGGKVNQSNNRQRGHHHARDAGIKNGALAAVLGGGGGTAATQEERSLAADAHSDQDHNHNDDDIPTPSPTPTPTPSAAAAAAAADSPAPSDNRLDDLNSHQTVIPIEDGNSSNAANAPRKKMLGKFLLGVKNYNKGVKAAPFEDFSGRSASPALSP